MEQPLLTILIPTLPERKSMLDKLMLGLHQQMNTLGYPITDIWEKCSPLEVMDGNHYRVKRFSYGKVEIIMLSDNKEYSIGDKRNILVGHATGKYCAFIDDDDMVSDNYFLSIFSALEKNPEADCCSLIGLYSEDGNPAERFEHSVKYVQWRTNDPKCEIRYERYINHLNVIRTDISRQVSFAEINHGEDHQFSNELMKRGLITKEAHIPETLYFYNYISNK